MDVKLLVSIPYYPGDLGRAYDNTMCMVDDDCWVCFIDHDAMFTTDVWYYQLCHAIGQNPKAGLFTCMTNRIGIAPQVHDPVRSTVERMPNVGSIVYHSKGNSHDMVHHHRVGKELMDQHGSNVADISKGISNGIMICTQKKIWAKTRGFRPGFGGQDTDYHREIVGLGYRAYMMKGLYLYHWYRQHLFLDGF